MDFPTFLNSHQFLTQPTFEILVNYLAFPVLFCIFLSLTFTAVEHHEATSIATGIQIIKFQFVNNTEKREEARLFAD